MPADESNALWIPNNNAFPGRNGYKARYIILHGTAGGTNAESTAIYFQSTQNGSNPVSSHYVIGQDGAVVQCVAEANAAWGNGALSAGHDPWWSDTINPNYLTISIEHVKSSTDNSDDLTPQQQNSSFALIKDICQRNNIPARAADVNGGITGHYSIDPVNRSQCPGSYPWLALWIYLKAGSSMIPSGWTDDGTILTAPNGQKVVMGFRDYILKNNWDANNWPLLPSAGLTPVEVSDPALGGGSLQPFRMGALAWTAGRGVYIVWIGQEYIKLYQLWIAAETDLKAARDQLAKSQDPAILQKLQDYMTRLNQINLASKIS
jgi:N-acetyl-anhydromuramyl-L-alanine amidase AmpD